VTRYLRWKPGSPVVTGRALDQLLIEYNEDGWAIRELGLDEAGVVIHRYPSAFHRWGQYGILADGYPEIVDQPIRGGLQTKSAQLSSRRYGAAPLLSHRLPTRRIPDGGSA
jgi:hypothetical protein